jgi:hypothetical protein
MRKVRAEWNIESVRIACNMCFASMGILSMSEVAAQGQAGLMCSTCRGINTLPANLLELSKFRKPSFDPDAPPGRGLAWDSLLGNIVLKRAMEVAIVGHHTVTYVGDPDIAWPEVNAIIGPKANQMTRCPCGNYGSMEKPCTCTLEQIETWRSSRKFKEAMSADIIVEGIAPQSDEIFAWSEPYSEVYRRVKQVRENQVFQRASFGRVNGIVEYRDREVLDYLSEMKTRLELTQNQIRSLCRVSLTIAEMAAEKYVTVVHVAEAVGYKTPLLLNY